MAACISCGAEVGCSCNLRVALDGAKVCGMCLASYNEKINQQNQQQASANQSISFAALNQNRTGDDAPTVTQITFNNFHS